MKLFYLTTLVLLSTTSMLSGQNSCLEALPVEAGSYSVDEIAGEQAPSPLCTESGGLASNGMWYVYQPTDTFTLIVTTSLPQNEGGDTRFQVYSGSCDNLQCVGGDDDGGSGYLSIDFIDVFPEETYYIAFDNWWSSNGFDFLLFEDEYSPPTPDIFSFTPETYELPGSMRGGVDMNGDNLDDLVYVDAGFGMTEDQVNIAQQAGSGVWEEVNVPLTSVEHSPSWSMAAGDIDANGLTDLVFGGGSGVSIMFRSDDGSTFEEYTTDAFVFSQRSNMVDINNDGFLDVFVCHDIDTNVYFINDGMGNMEYIKGGLGDLAGGGNYGSIWTDYDNDGDVDLFIAKCRGGDPILSTNEMHRNNGDGTYTEVGEEIGLADPIQTWSSAWGDFDNDGDMDVFVGASSFSAGGHKFMINNGDGTFSDQTAGTGFELTTTTSIEWVTHDFDNDGYLDIMGGGGTIFRNNGDLSFQPSNTDFANGPVGDFNNDGFLDVLSSSSIWYNDGNENNYLIVHTEGTESNVDGIGARIEVVTPNLSQIREVRSGDGFRYMSSLNAHFGLGTDEVIESVTVTWPSGIVDVIEDVDINQTLVVVEGQGPLTSTREEERDFNVYPNPATTELFFNSSEEVLRARVQVFDVQGKLVIDEILNSNSLNVSQLKQGNYVLRLTGDEMTAEQKFYKL